MTQKEAESKAAAMNARTDRWIAYVAKKPFSDEYDVFYKKTNAS